MRTQQLLIGVVFVSLLVIEVNLWGEVTILGSSVDTITESSSCRVDCSRFVYKTLVCDSNGRTHENYCEFVRHLCNVHVQIGSSSLGPNSENVSTFVVPTVDCFRQCPCASDSDVPDNVCTWLSAPIADNFLAGYACSQKRYKTLEEAQNVCCNCSACNGVVFGNSRYSARVGSRLEKSQHSEQTWVRLGRDIDIPPQPQGGDSVCHKSPSRVAIPKTEMLDMPINSNVDSIFEILENKLYHWENVMIFDSTLHFFGHLQSKNSDEMEAFAEFSKNGYFQISLYVYENDVVNARTVFHLNFEDGGLDWTECDIIESRITLLAGSREPGNPWHCFSEFIMPLYGTVERYIDRPDILLIPTSTKGNGLTASFPYTPVICDLEKFQQHTFQEITELKEWNTRFKGKRVCFPDLLTGLSHSINIWRTAFDVQQFSKFRTFFYNLYGDETAELLQYYKELSTENNDTIQKCVKQKQFNLVLISRKGSRRIENKQDVVLLCQSMGFNTSNVDFAASSVSDTLEIMSKADVLMGIHGAGLTNGIFLKPNAVLIQITSDDMRPGAGSNYKRIPNLVGADFFLCDQCCNTTKGTWMRGDMLINLGLLEDLLQDVFEHLTNLMSCQNK